MGSFRDIERQCLRASLQARLFDVEPNRPRVGKYELREPLGEGMMGTVYRAFDPDLDRFVALKLMRSTRPGPTAADRMLQEAKALARLNHPNVVTVHEAARYGDGVFIAMELVRGSDLEAWAREHPPDSKRRFRAVLPLLVDAADALAAAHEAGVVHRDLKPSNLLLGEDGRLRLADFGLARADDETGRTHESSTASDDALVSRLTATHELLGTPGYMAPEQFEGHTDPLSDQFSFCVTCFELLYGVRPFAGDRIAALRLSIHREAVRPAPDGTGVPRWIHPVLARGLRLDPQARYPNVAALRDAIVGADRRMRRRPQVIAAAAGGLTLLAAPLLAPPSEAEQCAEATAEVDRFWNETRRDKLHRALVRTNVPYAEGTWSLVETRIDSFASAWATARTDACTSPEEQRRARTECLDDALIELDATLELLAATNASTLEEAPRLASSLPDLQACRRARQARAPEHRKIARAIVRRVARSHRLTGLRNAEARRLATASLTDATEANLPALEFEAALGLAVVEHVSRDPEASVRAAERALRAAERTQDPHRQFQAWLRLAQSHHRRDLDDADFALRRASSLLELIEEPRWRVAAVDAARGYQRWYRGDITGSVESYRAAVDAIEPFVDDYPSTAATILNDAAGALLQTGSSDEAVEMLERTVAIFESLHGSASPKVAAPLVVLAQALETGEHHQRALAALAAAKDKLTAAPPSYRGVRAAVAMTSGTVLHQLDRKEEAIAAFRQSLAFLDEADDIESEENRRVARLGLAEVLRDSGQHGDAVAIYDALIAEEAPDAPPSFATGVLRVNATLAHAQLGHVQTALRLGTDARRILESIVEPGSQPHTHMLQTLASAYVDIEAWELALAHADEGLSGSPDTPSLRGHLEAARAEALAGLQRHPEAQAAAVRAREAFEASGEAGKAPLEDLSAWESAQPWARP